MQHSIKTAIKTAFCKYTVPPDFIGDVLDMLADGTINDAGAKRCIEVYLQSSHADFEERKKVRQWCIKTLEEHEAKHGAA